MGVLTTINTTIISLLLQHEIYNLKWNCVAVCTASSKEMDLLKVDIEQEDESKAISALDNI